MKSTAEAGVVRRSLLALAGGEVFARLIAFVGTAYLARVLGPEGFGLIGLGLALTGYLSVAITAGLNSVGAREVARQPGRAPSLAASMIALRAWLAAGAILVLAAVLALLPQSTEAKLVLLLFGVTLVPLALDCTWVHKGLEQNRRVGVALVLAQVVFVVTVLIVIREPGDIWRVPLALTGAQLVAAAFLAIPLFRGQVITIRTREALSLFKASSYRIGTKLFRLLMYTFDVLLLAVVFGEATVGLYAAPYRVCFLLSAISMAVAVAYLPMFARAARDEPETMTPILERSMRTVMTLALPIVVGGVCVAEPLLVLLFGKAYAHGSVALQLLLVSVSFTFVRELLQNVFLAMDKLGLELRIMAVGTAMNVALNLLLIPVWGITGAAFAAVAAEAMIVIMCARALRDVARLPSARVLVPVGAAVTIMALVVMVLGEGVHVLIRVSAGAMTYAAALVVLRGVPGDIYIARAK